jgi:hypothetical protein
MKGKLCYFNQTFNVYLYSISERCEDWKTVKETKLRIHNDSATFRLTEYDVEGFTFYTFGILCDKMEDRPNHKGEWSSNDSMVKELFGLELLPIGLDGISASMSYDNIAKVINPDVFQRGCSSLGLSSEIVNPVYGQWYDENGNEICIKKCIICDTI